MFAASGPKVDNTGIKFRIEISLPIMKQYLQLTQDAQKYDVYTNVLRPNPPLLEEASLEAERSR